MKLSTTTLSSIAAFIGILTSVWHQSYVDSAALLVEDLFMRILQLLSLPLIFLSLTSTLIGLEDLKEAKNLGRRVVNWTILTTLIAATIACVLFTTLKPAQSYPQDKIINQEAVIKEIQGISYLNYLKEIIPNNLVEPFATNNVMSVLILAILVGVAGLSLTHAHRKTIQEILASLYALVLKITSLVVYALPAAIWAFVHVFMMAIPSKEQLHSLSLYLVCILLANVIQGLLILPGILKVKSLKPVRLAKAMSQALAFAFFSKSSSATLPLAMKCAQENAQISQRVSSFSFPLCTTINMNGCAAFIYTTVLYVAMVEGLHFSTIDFVLWIFIATAAAVGNAGIPMGCFFLSSSFLASMNVPLHLMGMILPFYTLLDMVETALNVWSDSCVTALVDKDLKKESSTI